MSTEVIECSKGRAKKGVAQLKKVENAARRRVVFFKRRNGLLKKAFELSALCDAEVALLIFSESGKLYQFSNRELLMWEPGELVKEGKIVLHPPSDLRIPIDEITSTSQLIMGVCNTIFLRQGRIAAIRFKCVPSDLLSATFRTGTVDIYLEPGFENVVKLLR